VAQLQRQGRELDRLVISLPCGNLGNLTAGIMAKRMGLPLKRFIAADNANDVFTRYLRTGKFEPKSMTVTLAKAIDVGNPRNFPRILDLFGGSHEAIAREVAGVSMSDSEIHDSMKRLWIDRRYLADPHGALALEALGRLLHPGETGVALATAHPAKYIDAVEDALEQSIPVPNAMLQYLRGTRNVVSMNSGYASLRRFLLSGK
ncbi:MAG: pyridoxal-phosphate dependent enzyme, partial [Muribaculaceae bacterium]|nr:pyridoxal-phosphate dependent enzyme [Muribaculaceae bacterium]